MAQLFPEVRNDDEFGPFRRDEQVLGPGIRAICERLGLSGAKLARFPDGTRPVYAVDETNVLKVYPPFELRDHETEAAVLEAIGGRLSIPTPRLHALGELEGWRYILMQRLPGESLAEAWPQISPAGRLDLAARLGEGLSELHATRPPNVAGVRIDWAQFLSQQSSTCIERQRKRGLGTLWLEQIPEFLRAAHLDPAARPALLHTELMREHLLVVQESGGWAISGLFDFEPAMQGAAEYDFGALGLFFSCGSGALLRRVLSAYGYSTAQLDAALQHRLMAYTLLHRYSNLRWYLDRMPLTGTEQSLDALARRWWALDD